MYKRGEVCLVDFGDENVIGSEQRGRRPAVIVQNNVGNTYSTTVIVATITKKESSQPTQVDITSLTHKSIIMTEQLRTISKDRIIKKIVTLKDSEIQALDTALKVSLSLD